MRNQSAIYSKWPITRWPSILTSLMALKPKRYNKLMCSSSPSGTIMNKPVEPGKLCVKSQLTHLHTVHCQSCSRALEESTTPSSLRDVITPTQLHKTWIFGEERIGQFEDWPLIDVFQEHFLALKLICVNWKRLLTNLFVIRQHLCILVSIRIHKLIFDHVHWSVKWENAG